MALEARIQQLSVMEGREEELRRQLAERSNSCKDLASRVTELEDRAEVRERDYVSTERLYKKRQEQDKHRIDELEAQVSS